MWCWGRLATATCDRFNSSILARAIEPYGDEPNWRTKSSRIATSVRFRRPVGVGDSVQAQLVVTDCQPREGRPGLLLSTEDKVVDDAIEVAKQLARGGPNAYRAVKREVNRLYPRMDRMSMDESLASDEPIEGFHAFRERRSPDWVADDLQIPGRL